MSANEMLIQNLETQLDRLVAQLRDLEEAKEDLDEEEFEAVKEDTVEQIREFNERLGRMNQGDVTLDSKLSTMKQSIRKAIATSFNTLEMIKMFGEQNATELEKQLLTIDEDFRLKKISGEIMEQRKVDILTKLKAQGHPLSAKDCEFIEKMNQKQLQGLEEITED
ncbi:protein LZIC-like [Phlebotomus argentipes]|uniref:protein LZIC-like n=1 Tax=Phlebotomus argentipes TaxID=94469 RepID=UPI002892E0F4|nr:protein LZIC-like [Phlebotomus argentipes]